jgi:hypothetical protein
MLRSNADSMSRDEHFAHLVRRAWTTEERDQVIRGFSGRLLIAIEPFICSIVLALLTIAPFLWTHVHEITTSGLLPPRFTLAQILAPILGFGAVGFGIYTVWVMLGPCKAMLSTLAPIYIVDGYLQYRTKRSAEGILKTAVAILSHEQNAIQEWVAPRTLPVRDGIYPAHVEFSRYGGILRIDGRQIDPPLFALAPFGIGTFTALKR